MNHYHGEIIQRNEFRMIGVSRSGNHGVINWILNQLNGGYCFLNCTEPKHNPYVTCRPLGENENPYLTNIPGFELKEELQGNFTEKDFLIYSHEDCFLGGMAHPSFVQNRKNWLGDSEKTKDVLILRDPFNLFASRIKSGLMRGHYTHHGAKPISTLTLKRIYKQHAREFLREKRYLKNPVLINYNRWAADKSYRKSIASELGIPFSDKGFEIVSSVAGGSSFDGTKLSGKAQKMRVNSRWKLYAEDEDYRELFDEELIDLTERIFGEIPPVNWYKKEHKLSAAEA